MSVNGMTLDHDELARVLAVLAHPVRLRILERLLSECRRALPGAGCCVTEINEQVGVAQPVLSKHLKVLREAGILRGRREGNRMVYSMETGGALGALVAYLQGLETCCRPSGTAPSRPAERPQTPPVRPTGTDPRSISFILL